MKKILHKQFTKEAILSPNCAKILHILDKLKSILFYTFPQHKQKHITRIQLHKINKNKKKKKI